MYKSYMLHKQWKSFMFIYFLLQSRGIKILVLQLQRMRLVSAAVAVYAVSPAVLQLQHMQLVMQSNCMQLRIPATCLYISYWP